MKWVGQNIQQFISRFRQKVYIENSDIEISKVSGQSTLELSAWSATATAAHAGRIKFLKSGTAAVDTYTAGNHTTSGEILGRIEAYGIDDGDGETLSSYIEFANDAVSDADSSPGKIVFATSDADDAGTPTVRLTIDDDGLATFSGSVSIDSVSVSAIQTSAESFVDNDTSLMTSAAIDDRINTAVTAEDLDVTSDDGTIAIDLNSETLSIIGGAGIDTDASGNQVNIVGAVASTTAVGVIELATTAETTTGTAGNRAVTPDGLKDGYQGSANVVTLGTIGTGVWNGTAVASAYLDSDTAHLTTAQTFTGAKTFGTTTKLQFRDANAYINSPDSNDLEIAATDITLDAAGIINLEGPVRPTGQLQLTYHNFTDDIDTTKIYLSLADSDTEGTVTTAIKLPFTAPLAGKLMRVYLRGNQNHSGNTLTWRLETNAAGVTLGTTPTIIGTQSGTGCTNSNMTTYDFTSSLDSGDNIIDAGDMVFLSIQSSGATANTKFFVTCLWEWDFSTIG